MSEPKLISPLLDGFTMGNPISDHDGVRCCPAIKENSDEKYIVKVISIPSSQVQMDALLLAGAYKDASGAMDYFKTVVGDVCREAELLQKLAKLEGFLCYEGWQMEPITRRRLGYEVYLLAGYRRSLDKFVRRSPITQLQAINLGLDMCAALSVCRQAGALYVDLKPTNIFVSDKKEYRIGDLGFVSMDALSYTALPDKYRSPYTPPELLDPMASLNLTVDTYALGMILYQLHNDGQLPPKDTEGGIPSPAHADYELAELILKAIAENPEDRWQDPREFGQALVAYMQRNTVNDVPITPYVPLEVPEEAPAQTPVGQEAASDAAPEPQADKTVPEDETAPSEEDAASLLPHEMSDELSRMISKADDLIAHEAPEGVVVPEAPPQDEDPFAFAKDEDADSSDVPIGPMMEEAPPQEKKKKAGSFASQAGKQKAKSLLTTILCLVLLSGAGFGLTWLYSHLYVQTIDSLTITGNRDQLTVAVDTKANEAILTVLCTDQYGNVVTKPLVKGKATFTGLVPNTMYTLSLEVEGFHKLSGHTSEVFTTDTTTRIVSFTSVAGSEDGSLILNFTVDGTEPEEWILTYSAEGEETKQLTFSGHSLPLEGLRIGKTYTFTLDAGPNLSLGGQTTLEAMASRLILAENIQVASSDGSDVTVSWKAPGDILVDSWKVRCYGEGYDQEFNVQDTQVCFTGLDFSQGYTLEITAAGMTQPARASISPNPINITGLSLDESDPRELLVDWDYTGESPDGGWLLLYSVDGNDSQSVIKSGSSSAVIYPRIPDAQYRFTIRAADGNTVLTGVHDRTTGAAGTYDSNGLTAASVTASLLHTPAKDNWRFEQVEPSAVTTQFAAGEPISVGLKSSTSFYRPGEEVMVLLVVRNAQGKVMPGLTSKQTWAWRDIWAGNDATSGQLDLPKSPEYGGNYSLTIYVDGAILAKADFTVTD